MNIAKHMEAVFVVALAAAACAGFAASPLEQAQARPAAIQDSSIATETRMAVVVVKGKRLAQQTHDSRPCWPIAAKPGAAFDCPRAPGRLIRRTRAPVFVPPPALPRPSPAGPLLLSRCCNLFQL